MCANGKINKFYLSIPGFTGEIDVPEIDDYGIDDSDPFAHVPYAPHPLAATVCLNDLLLEETRRMYPLDPQAILQHGMERPPKIRREIQEIRDRRDRLIRQITADQVDELHKMMRQQQEQPPKAPPTVQEERFASSVAPATVQAGIGTDDEAICSLEALRQKAWLTEIGAARLLSLPAKALGNRRRDGHIPRELYDQNGEYGHVRYRTKLLLDYAEQGTRGLPRPNSKKRAKNRP